MIRTRNVTILVACLWIVGACSTTLGQPFNGFDSATLEAVPDEPDAWGLKIVVFSVGSADAILILAPNGDVVLVDSGKTKTAGDIVADYLGDASANGVGVLKVIALLYTTHYDQDHIGGIKQIVDRRIGIRKALDQGLSTKRHDKPFYTKYVKAVGDLNDNLVQDANEPNFVRHRIDFGHVERIRKEDNIEIRCVGVRGDTAGTANDIMTLDPATTEDDDFNENPGSIALVVRLGEFEFYTAGDQTDNDWRSMPAVEESIIAAGAIPGGHDIDVLKVSHHGSNTSSSVDFVKAIDPEVAIISTKWHGGFKFPRKVVLKQFQDNRCFSVITGDSFVPGTTDFFASPTSEASDPAVFTVNPNAVLNDQGDVAVLVSTDGKRYTVRGKSFAKTFSAVDADNGR